MTHLVRATILITSLMVSFPAQAIPCWLIKLSYAPFAKQGIKAAEKWARAHGYSEQAIKEARQCLSGR